MERIGCSSQNAPSIGLAGRSDGLRAAAASATACATLSLVADGEVAPSSDRSTSPHAAPLAVSILLSDNKAATSPAEGRNAGLPDQHLRMSAVMAGGHDGSHSGLSDPDVMPRVMSHVFSTSENGCEAKRKKEKQNANPDTTQR
jgi:hypothetical protein